ncbi:MAG: type II secretion system protein [Hyphomicrobiaceae bacterium]|nr:type II secretion system protein [Hyphomicrobiaceae bacterium]
MRPRAAPACGASSGYSLIEMIVVLLIVSVLAGMAAPVASKKAEREKAFALKATLREVRGAIDRFHADWEEAKGGAGFAKAASADGYPISFDVLVEGVDGGDATGKKRRYLRAVPRNPFMPLSVAADKHWHLISYQDDPKSKGRLAGRDIYDLRSAKEGEALDGSRIEECVSGCSARSAA